MANITIKELLASDKVNELVDKINFNFDQLLLNGGGPIGLKGGPGEQGPIGPRGSVWFTSWDLWLTPNSPTWLGSPERANNPLNPGYPQYKGDPNRYQPVATISSPAPWTNPEYTFTFSTPNKPVRGGDLYLQEGDDNFNSQVSKDGDVWEYSQLTGEWVYTGVNLKGSTGGSGSNALSDWVRESSGTDEIIYPKDITGQDTTRVYIGARPTPAGVFNLDNGSALLTINTDQTHFALNNPVIHNETVSVGSENLGTTMTVTSSGDFLLLGSSSVGTGITNQIIIQSNDTNIFIQSGGSNFLTYKQEPGTSTHNFQGGRIEINHPNTIGLKETLWTAQSSATQKHTLTQIFNTAENRVEISTYADGYGLPFQNLLAAPHIIFQQNNINKNVGIGQFSSGQNPQSKLGIRGNLSVGYSYAHLPATPDGAIIEGRVAIGTPTFPANSAHKVQVNGSIIIGEENNIIGDNIYWDFISSSFKPIYGTTGNGRAAWFIKQNPTNIDTDAELDLSIFPITEPGSNSGSNPVSNPGSSVIAIRQSKNQHLGKLGVNIGGWATDSRITINDTDGTGLHFIRFGTLTPGSTEFYSNINRGARIYHSVSGTVSESSPWGTGISVDRTFNIYQLEPADFVIGNIFGSSLHPRIVIKGTGATNGFIGINNSTPKHIVTIRGRDAWNENTLLGTSIPSPDVADPDEINMGTFEDRSINSLNVDTRPMGTGSNVETNIPGGAYIGFNAWFSNPNAPLNAPEVIYGRHEDGTNAGWAGAIIFADRNGNLHFANYEERPFVAGGGIGLG